ncbi:polynucleotide 5'-hydroxyl-kinase NOL9-like [Palaemon carinicauda]|uniref:polynucleotide 5'-hydroxyl-kinase NOL9-like n=1 Tax=Palaemon carinicauda TaxID=392227 RepID=UPI0035B5EE80
MFSVKNVKSLNVDGEELSVKPKKSPKRKRQLSKGESVEGQVDEKPKPKKSGKDLRQGLSVDGIEADVKEKQKFKKKQSNVDGAKGVIIKEKGKEKKQLNPNLPAANTCVASKEKYKHKKQDLGLSEGDSVTIKKKHNQKKCNLNGTDTFVVNKEKVENSKFQVQRLEEVRPFDGKKKKHKVKDYQVQNSEGVNSFAAGKKKHKMKKHQPQNSEETSNSVIDNPVKPETASLARSSKNKKPVIGLKLSKGTTKERNAGRKSSKKKGQTLKVMDMQQLEKDLEECIVGKEAAEGATALPECKFQNDDLFTYASHSGTDVIGKKLSKKMKSLQLSTSIDKQSDKVPKKSVKKVKKSAGSVKKKKKNAVETEQEYGMKTETFNNQRLVSSPKQIFTIGKDAYIIVLSPGQSLYVHGLVSVQNLVGKVTVLGYKMNELDKQNIFSFNSHALLCINATEGSKLNAHQHSYLLNYGLPRHQLEEAAKRETESLVIFELRKVVLPIVKRLTIIDYQHLMAPKQIEGRNTLHGLIVTEENCHKYHLVEESDEWKEIIDSITLSFECGNAPRVVLCGGKSVGKSTLFKYIVNGLLSKKGTVVQCLDTDPGQSELSLPSCLSLTQVSEPLLGPAYTHYADPSSPHVKQIMVGDVSPQFGLQRYVKAMKDLFELSKKHPDRPLVVNTMGWTVGTGLELMLDLIRIVAPSHVLQIRGNAKTNFHVILNDFVVRDYLGGICTKPNDYDLHYNLTTVRSLSGRKNKGNSLTPKLLRELAVLLQLSDILIDFAENPSDQEDGSHLVIVPWPNVVLHVCGSKVPKERILHVLNGNLVALCKVDSSKVEFVARDLPKQLSDDLDFGQCLGWGVVRGIDPLTKSLHILTTVQPEVIGTKINAIVKPELYIPDLFYNFFTSGEGPYFQKMYRSGAGKLKISRQIKPNMAKLGQKKDN